ncbi:hypothetical protein BRD08_09870 [Halobacteriales archaeon SW_10_66_29]|nr:MAG: hypothetical protein BRD08_09870 [Halobacteriales archaeon SW_10_66_29]
MFGTTSQWRRFHGPKLASGEYPAVKSHNNQYEGLPKHGTVPRQSPLTHHLPYYYASMNIEWTDGRVDFDQ